MPPTLDLSVFVHAAADAIIAAGADGRIVFWNPAATRIFGFSETEAVGQSLDLIIPVRFRARHWEGYRQVMNTGTSKYAADVRDETTRWQEERELKRRLAELEDKLK